MPLHGVPTNGRPHGIGPSSPGAADSGRRSRGALVERVTGWSIRHRAWAIAGWFALVVGAVVSSGLVTGVGARSSDPGEAGRARRVLQAQQTFEPIRENVLVQARESGGPRLVEDPELRRATADLVATLRQAPDAVTDVRSPLAPDEGVLVSQDGRSGLVTFLVAGPDDQRVAHYEAAVEAVETVQARHPRARLAQAGDRSLASAVDQAISKDFRRSELISLPLTLVILLVVFGSVIAAGIPVLLTLTIVVTTFSLLGVIEHWMAINSAVFSMVLLIGVAVGVDYSLFYLRREREERAAGRDIGEALGITARTSGHVVAVSGLTVMLCMSGLLFTGIGTFRGLTVGTILIVGLAVVGSVTVLPALLAALDRWVDKGRIPWLGRRQTAVRESRFWSAVARVVVRRPLLCGGAATLVLVIMALPALGMRLQDPAVTDSLPRRVPAVDAAVRLQAAFPGAAAPARVVIWDTRGGAIDTPAVRQAVDGLHGQVAASGGTLAEPISVAAVDRALVVRIPLAGSGTDATSNRALETLRHRVLPATLGRVDGIDYAVMGRTAFAYDFAHRLNARTPIVFAFVLVVAFALLVVAFSSLAIAVVSIALNLLSIGAAYGILTWVFQDGHLASALDFTSYGGVVGWLPLFMFVILFGLSMDYHIFILSRIRERWLAGANAREAVVGGIGSSAGVVTSAAVIMTAVFTVFVTLSAIEYKMLGVGMAVAVLIDATIVRGVLLPALMALLGARAWALPRWLERLPGANKKSSPTPEMTPRPAAPSPMS